MDHIFTMKHLGENARGAVFFYVLLTKNLCVWVNRRTLVGAENV